MTKQNRLALIRLAHQKVCGASLPGVLPVSRKEIRDSFNRNAGMAYAFNQKDNGENEGGGFFRSDMRNSNLCFDSPNPRVERETDILLTQEEKNRLKKELGIRAVSPLPVSSVEIWPENPEAVYASRYSEDEDREARELANAWQAFENDCVLPLALTA